MSKKAVIYARYSSSSQNEQSIEGQLKECYEYASRNGITVIGEYIDRAVSGTSTTKRTEFQKMLVDSGRKNFDTLLIYRFDRFARSRYDDAVSKKILSDNGVNLISCTENIPDDPSGIILESLLVAMSEYYSAELSQKVTRGLILNAENGKFTGGAVPVGYKVVDSIVKIDDTVAPFIVKAFEMYKDGERVTSIAKFLAEKGITTSRYNKPITINTVYRILTNKKYIGKITFGGIAYDNYPIIVSKELFNEVQLKVVANNKTKGKNKATVEFLLSGKAFCGHCGAKLVGDSCKSRSGVKHYYYLCSNRKKLKSCGKRREVKHDLEMYVVEQTINHVLDPQRIKEISKFIVNQCENDSIAVLIKSYKKKLKNLEAELEKTFNLVLNSSISSIRAKAEEHYSKLEEQKSSLEIDILKLIAQKNNVKTEDEIVEFLADFCEGSLEDEEFKKRILNTLVHSVIISDDWLTIYYKTSENFGENIVINNSGSDVATSIPPPLTRPRRVLKRLQMQSFF